MLWPLSSLPLVRLQPKGVKRNHSQILHRAWVETNEYKVNAGDRIAHLFFCSAGTSTADIFIALLNGAMLCPYNVKEKGVEELADWLVEEKISHFHTPLSVFRQLIDHFSGDEHFPALRSVMLGGEALYKKDVERFRKYFASHCILIHRMATTETSLITLLLIDEHTSIKDDVIPSGYPVPGASVLILDEAGKELGFGQVGEIAVKSRYLAPGYWQRKELTQRVFLPAETGSRERIYLTGDLGHLRSDGCLYHMGRKDSQLKIRGYRVDVKSIEAILYALDSIRQSAVVAQALESGERRLVAYLVPSESNRLTISKIRQALAEKLPDYMIPTSFVTLDALPLTATGKVDQRALPAPNNKRPELDIPYVPPRTQLEETVAGIWAEVLTIDSIGIHDNFFELGGHSLLATQVISRLRSQLNLDIPILALFEASHLSDFAQVLSQARESEDKPIVRVSRDHPLPLSFAQQRLWFLDQLEPESAFYNMHKTLWLTGQLDLTALESAFRYLIERHESLRTVFGTAAEQTTDGEAVQIIHPPSWAGQFTLTVQPVADELEAQRMAQIEANTPFNLSKGPLLRVKLFQVADNDASTNLAGSPSSSEPKFLLVLTRHHIISDVWSMGVLVRECTHAYHAFATGQQPTLPDLPIQYADYAIWQRQQMERPAMQEQLSYWRRQLADAPTALDLPTDRPRPPIQGYHGAGHMFELSPNLYQALKDLSQETGGTLFTTLLAAFNVLLHRYSGQQDIMVGASIAGRNRTELEPLIGFFVNNLIYRTKLTDDPAFLTLLQRVHQTATEAYDNQDYPFDQLLNELKIVRDASRNPLAQVRFAFNQRDSIDFTNFLSRVETTPEPGEFEFARYDLNLRILDQDDGIQGCLSYNTDLFNEATVVRMAENFVQLLTSIVANPTLQVSQLKLLPDIERQKLLNDWNQTAQALPLDRPFHTLFETQVTNTPDAVAAVAGNLSLTYRELNLRANQLARLLAAHGLEPKTVVPLLARRNLDFLTAMLAIFKAGGVYLPLDPRNPSDRQAQILTQSRSTLILVADEFMSSLAEMGDEVSATVLNLAHCLKDMQSYPTQNLALHTGPDSLAYVIFTSGSTGLPKGAMVEQKGMVNHLNAKVLDLALTEGDQIAQTASQSFDISIWQFLAGLLVGGTVHIYNDEIALNPTLLLDHIEQDNISIWETVPSLMRALIDTIATSMGTSMNKQRYPLIALRWLIPTGEALPPQLANRWLTFYPHVPLLNAYGPTECSDDVTHYVIREPLPADVVHTPIGRPVVNTHAYVLDSSMQPTPIGVSGELWIGGVGVGRGYLNDPDRTAAAFHPDTFSDEPGSRLYKTGDRARYLPDGNIVFLGRLDYQVKIRGFRIELGEIEYALHQHPSVRECLVMVHEDETNMASQRLVSYWVHSAADDLPTVSELRNFLKDYLPDYMVPAFFMMLEEMPLTANGKIDRHALPDPTEASSTTIKEFVEPDDPLECFLAEHWQQTLKVETIGRHDNFFEIGGDSIRGAILITQLQEHFQEVLYVVALFESPTIAQLAEYLQQHYPEAVARVTGRDKAEDPEKCNGAKVDEGMIVEFRKLIPPLLPLSQSPTTKNSRAIFVLSAPRSGSTLFRVMLGGHAQLFSPPELDLLSFNTMGERATTLGGRFNFRLEGLLRAVMELLGCDADGAKAQLAKFEEEDVSVPTFYGQLQQWLGDGQLLVDKTPIYALDPNTLRRAEDYFEEVHYIHLLRHPAGMIRSFEKAHTDQVFFRYDHDFSTRQLAELVWSVSHQNILDFLQEIPAQRQHQVKYEELVTEPKATTQAICAFLKLPFDRRITSPYTDKEQRMTDGIYSVSKMLGDPKFHTHGQIDPKVADSWREHYTEDFIGEPTWTLATGLGYSHPMKQTVQPIQRVTRQRRRVKRGTT